MDQALDSYVIRGLAHNISLLRDICDNKRFREGNITTAFLSEEYPEGFSGMRFLCRDRGWWLSEYSCVEITFVIHVSSYGNSLGKKGTITFNW